MYPHRRPILIFLPYCIIALQGGLYLQAQQVAPLAQRAQANMAPGLGGFAADEALAVDSLESQIVGNTGGSNAEPRSFCPENYSRTGGKRREIL